VYYGAVFKIKKEIPDYVHSTTDGMTWSSPMLVNDPETNQYQSHWMPSVSVNYDPTKFVPPGQVTISCYDRRQATASCNTVTDPGCNYERFGRQSPNNGLTWGPNFAISDIIIPEPAQTDSGVQSCYAGDYDSSTAFLGNAFVTWTDGRVSVGGVQIQNVEFARVPD
jgi:hypothetical protein